MVGYSLTSDNNKCVSIDPNCQGIEPKSGLCFECKKDFKMIGFKCMNSSSEIQNCYLLSEALGLCIYCKPGYWIFYGACYPPDVVKDLVQGPSSTITCTENQYYNPSAKKCSSIPALCQQFDYGLLKCVFCWQTNILIDGLCREPSLRFCA